MENISGLKVLSPVSFSEDHRGEYLETWNIHHTPEIVWKQDDFSHSKYSVLRGLHGDNETWKLVQAIYGRLFLAVVDCRPNSSTFKKVQVFTLTDHTHSQILIPPGCVNGHQCLSSECIFHYKQSTLYGTTTQITVNWCDTELNIPWPIIPPILSQRDMHGDKPSLIHTSMGLARYDRKS